MEVKALLHSPWHFLNLWLLKTSAGGGVTLPQALPCDQTIANF